MNEWRALPMTEQQRDAIKRIQKHSRTKFKGKTRGDASDYIHDEIAKYQERRAISDGIYAEQGVEDAYDMAFDASDFC